MPVGDPGNPCIQCVAHLHGGPSNGAQMPLFYAKLEIPMPVWGDTFEDSTTALYRIRGPYLLQPVAHYDYVEPAMNAEFRRTGGLLRWLFSLCRT